jgi:hypothetical protein
MDLSDSKHDQERLRPDEATIDLPDVKDIPGQEFVQVPPLGMMADTTISSADEEGEGLFEDDEEDETDIVMGTEADITPAKNKRWKQAMIICQPEMKTACSRLHWTIRILKAKN